MLSTLKNGLSKRSVSKLVSQHARCFSLAAPAPEPSIWEKIFSKTTMPVVPLDAPFPGVPAIAESSNGAVAKGYGELERTTLSNGLRIATTEGVSPISSMGIFIDAGSRYEHPDVAGISHFLETIAFKSTENVSDFRLVRDMLKLGANVMASSSQEAMIYSADCMNQYVPEVVSTLADVIQRPALNELELQEAASYYTAMIPEREKAPDFNIMHGIHGTAYANQTVGNPTFATAHSIQNIHADTIRQYIDTFYTPKRMVISAAGVNHKDFVDLCADKFNALPADLATPVPKVPAQYVGGDRRVFNSNEPLLHLCLAFETANWNSEQLVPMCVLQTMMGGGGSFSAGGPGKGMYTRLYLNVLNNYKYVESVTSFNCVFSDTALFGMYGTTTPENASQLTSILVSEAQKMAGPVEAGELDRAKNQLKSSVLMQLENRHQQVEDMGRQLLMYNKVDSPETICAKIDAVSASDIQSVARAMLKTAPSVSAFGDTTSIPRYDVIASQFN